MNCLFCLKEMFSKSNFSNFECDDCQIAYFMDLLQIFRISYLKNSTYEVDFYPRSKEMDFFDKKKNKIVFTLSPMIGEVFSLEKFEYYIDKLKKIVIFS